MACMTHRCTNPECGHVIFNNSRGPYSCPICNSMMMRSFDESENEDDFMEYDDIDRANEYKE